MKMRLAGLVGLGLLLGLTGVKAQSCQSTAHYEIDFSSDWTAESHPDDYPGNPHFSGLVGATHNSSVVLWEPGTLASEGVKDVAERGNKDAFLAEIAAFDDAGHIGETLNRGGLGAPPISRTIKVSATCDFSQLTLISMLAPSPDWFVGFHGLPLFEDGSWIKESEHTLFAYDAGTDSGISYADQNDPTDPPVAIELADGFPFLVNGEVRAVAKFHVRLVYTEALSLDPEQWTRYYPLEIGNQWQYAGTQSGENGQTEEYTKRVLVVREETIGDRKYFVLEVEIFKGASPTVTAQYVRYDSTLAAVQRLDRDSGQESLWTPCRLDVLNGPAKCTSPGDDADHSVTSTDQAEVTIGSDNVVVSRAKVFELVHRHHYAARIGLISEYHPDGNLEEVLTYASISGKEYGSPSQSTSHEDLIAAKGISLEGIYPNPATDRATVSISAPAAEAAVVEVFDVLGRSLIPALEIVAGLDDVVLDTSSLPGGTYLLRMTANHGAAVSTAPFQIVR